MAQFRHWPSNEKAIEDFLGQVVEDIELDLVAGKEPLIAASFKEFAKDDDEPENRSGSGPQPRF